MIDLSVIVPAYNCEKFIERCLNSILNQSALEIEIIIINDGSTDNTNKICEEYVDKHNNIKLINKINEGQGIARNLGIKKAKGKYITFVDSDDYVNRNCYTIAVELLEKNNADLFVGQIKKVSENENLKVALNNKNIIYHEYNDNKSDMIKSILAGRDINENCRVSSSTCDKIYTKKVLDVHNMCFLSEREYLSEDILFNIMYLKVCKKCVVSNMEMYNYVTNTNSFCHTYQKDYVEKMYKMLGVLNSYKFDITDEEYSRLVSEKIYGYIKSYMFQEVEHQSLRVSGRNIKLLCQKEFVSNLLFNLDKMDFSMLDHFIVLFAKKKLGLIIALFYKLKFLIFRMRNTVSN